MLHRGHGSSWNLWNSPREQQKGEKRSVKIYSQRPDSSFVIIIKSTPENCQELFSLLLCKNLVASIRENRKPWSKKMGCETPFFLLDHQNNFLPSHRTHVYIPHTFHFLIPPTKKPSTVLWKLFGLILSGIYASRPELTNINYIENLAQSPFYAGLSRKFPYILTLTLSLKLKRRNFTLIISSSLSIPIIPELSWHDFWFKLDCSLWSRQIDFLYAVCGLTEPMPEAIRCSLSVHLRLTTIMRNQMDSISGRTAPHTSTFLPFLSF